MQRSKAVKEIIKSLGAATKSVGESEERGETETQQLCPIESIPTTFLRFEPDKRIHPINTPRGSNDLNEFEGSLNSMESSFDTNKPLYLPQGIHLVTRQAVPPLFNNPRRLSNGEDTAALSNAISSSCFAIQVINKNSIITKNAVPGALKKLYRFKDVVKGVQKGRVENSSLSPKASTIKSKRKS